MALEIYAPLVGYAVATSFTPGPNNTMLAASGAQFGFARTRPHLFGVALGFGLMIFLVALGLGGSVSRLPGLNLALTLIGGALLLWMSWRIASAPVGEEDEERARARPLTFLQGAGFQWINPKGWTMALAVAGSYITGAAPLREAAICGVIFALVGIASAATWAGFGVSLRRWLTSPLRRRIFNVSMGALLAGFVIYGAWPVVRAALA